MACSSVNLIWIENIRGGAFQPSSTAQLLLFFVLYNPTFSELINYLLPVKPDPLFEKMRPETFCGASHRSLHMTNIPLRAAKAEVLVKGRQAMVVISKRTWKSKVSFFGFDDFCNQIFYLSNVIVRCLLNWHSTRLCMTIMQSNVLEYQKTVAGKATEEAQTTTHYVLKYLKFSKTSIWNHCSPYRE